MEPTPWAWAALAHTARIPAMSRALRTPRLISLLLLTLGWPNDLQKGPDDLQKGTNQRAPGVNPPHTRMANPTSGRKSRSIHKNVGRADGSDINVQTAFTGRTSIRPSAAGVRGRDRPFRPPGSSAAGGFRGSGLGRSYTG